MSPVKRALGKSGQTQPCLEIVEKRCVGDQHAIEKLTRRVDIEEDAARRPRRRRQRTTATEVDNFSQIQIQVLAHASGRDGNMEWSVFLMALPPQPLDAPLSPIAYFLAPDPTKIVAALVHVEVHPDGGAIIFHLKDQPRTLLYAMSRERATEMLPTFQRWIKQQVPIEWTYDQRTRRLLGPVRILHRPVDDPPCTIS